MNILNLPELETLNQGWVKCLQSAVKDAEKHGFGSDTLITWKDTDQLTHLENPVRMYVGEYLDHQSYVEWMGWSGDRFLGILPIDATTIHTSIRHVKPVGRDMVIEYLRDHCKTGCDFSINGIDRVIRLVRGSRCVNGTLVGVKVDAYRIQPIEPRYLRKRLMSDGCVEILSNA